jgi:hypothetical protein
MAVVILLLVVEGKAHRGFSPGKMEGKGSSSARVILKISSHVKILVVLSLDHLQIRISEAMVGGGGTMIKVFKAQISAVVLVSSIKVLLMAIAISSTEVTTHTVGLIGSSTTTIGLIIMEIIIVGMVTEAIGMMC